MDGSQVEALYRAGTVESHQKLAAYAMRDVELLREVYLRLFFEQGVSLQD